MCFVRNRVTNTKSRNLSKMLFYNPAEAVALLLVGQIVFVNAFIVHLNSSSAMENSSLLFENEINYLSDAKEGLSSNNSTYNALNEDNTLNTTSELRLEETADDVVEISSNSALLPLSNKTRDMDETVRQNMTCMKMMYDVRRSKRSSDLSGSFTRPDSSSKVAMLANEMRKMKEEIAQLRNSATISSEDKARLAYLETTIESSQKRLDDQSKQLEQKIERSESLVETLINTVNLFRTELDDMKKKAVEQEKIEKQKRLPAECVDAIRSHNFKSAAEKLQEIDDDNKINLIIKDVYSYQTGNFDLVLEFGDTVRSIRRSFFVYKALNYEMNSNGHKDLFKMMKLIKSLKKEIINQQNVLSDIKEGAESLVGDLNNKIKLVFKEMLKDGMLFDRYVSVETIADDVYNFDSTLFDNSIENTVDDVYGRLNTEKLITMIRSHRYIGQSIYGYAAVLNNMNRNDDLNDSVIFKLAIYIKELMEMPNYPSVDSEIRSIAERMKTRLPHSIKNAAFSTKVCIKNIAYGEYLYAAGINAPGSRYYQYDGDRRYAFTWVPGNIDDNQFYWKIEPKDNGARIKNTAHNEYLYAAGDVFKYDNERRRVFTWIPGDRVLQGTWKFEPLGNYVRIKNVHHTEYLFADFDRKRDNDRRYVYTFIPGRTTSDSTWSIEDCS